MKPLMIVGIVLIALGVLGLVYGGFTYTKDSSTADLGPLKLTVNEKETINIPVWAGAGAVIVGAGLLVLPWFKR